MALYVVIEGHGEIDAVQALLGRYVAESGLALPHAAPPIRGQALHKLENVRRYGELVRRRRDAEALLLLRDDEDGCPHDDGPRDAAVLRDLALPFPAAVVLAYREYESLFLPCIEHLAGKAFDVPGGLTRPGLRADARWEGADYESKRDVKGWLTSQMPAGVSYKPTLDQLPLTRMVEFAAVRARGLRWFGTLERALAFLATKRRMAGEVYPPAA